MLDFLFEGFYQGSPFINRLLAITSINGGLLNITTGPLVSFFYHWVFIFWARDVASLFRWLIFVFGRLHFCFHGLPSSIVVSLLFCFFWWLPSDFGNGIHQYFLWCCHLYLFEGLFALGFKIFYRPTIFWVLLIGFLECNDCLLLGFLWCLFLGFFSGPTCHVYWFLYQTFLVWDFKHTSCIYRLFMEHDNFKTWLCYIYKLIWKINYMDEDICTKKGKKRTNHGTI